jgi:hypothetical protein
MNKQKDSSMKDSLVVGAVTIPVISAATPVVALTAVPQRRKAEPRRDLAIARLTRDLVKGIQALPEPERSKALATLATALATVVQRESAKVVATNGTALKARSGRRHGVTKRS